MKPGTELGHYRILASIGEGGMGEVWKALDTNLDREVAIKFVHPRLAAGVHAVERLRIKARAASGMNHPNICTFYARWAPSSVRWTACSSTSTFCSLWTGVVWWIV